MKKKGLLLLLLALCMTASLNGCRKKLAPETETSVVTEVQTEKITEKETEKQTEKATEKETEKETQKQTTKTTEKTTVKPSTVKPTTPAPTTQETKMCPYCYNYISLQPNGDGTTVYSVHVAQEKAWADTFGYGTTQPSTQASTQPSTQASTNASSNTTVDDSAQCSYCYQWFSVSDGSYASHIAQEQNSIVNGSVTVEYIQCPNCSNVYPSGIAYNTHLCSAVQ